MQFKTKFTRIHNVIGGLEVGGALCEKVCFDNKRFVAGRLGEAGAALAAVGDFQGAVRFWLKGGRARRAANLLLQQPQLLRDNDIVDSVHTQLIQVYYKIPILYL